MCHSRLPTPETAFSLCASTRLPSPPTACILYASISGNGGQVDRREKSYAFSMLHRKDLDLCGCLRNPPKSPFNKGGPFGQKWFPPFEKGGLGGI